MGSATIRLDVLSPFLRLGPSSQGMRSGGKGYGDCSRIGSALYRVKAGVQFPASKFLKGNDWIQLLETITWSGCVAPASTTFAT